jgi:DNA-binding NarL/FixJ family response regulator
MSETAADRYGPDGDGPNGPVRATPWGRAQLAALLRPLAIAICPAVKRILVIDDDTKLRQHYAALLRLEGFEVTEARNGRDGVDQARREPPDLVLCDITMPEMNGHRVLETLRAEPRTAHLPFVFLTGWSEQDDVRTGMNLGADDYLTKPVAPGDLTAAIRARLRRAEIAGGAGKRGQRESTPAELEPFGLTPREAEVLFWVARGKTNDEIATVLGIGLTTVKKHLESTFAKLGVENRTAAAAMALERIG